MANYLLGIVKLISGPSTADASEQQRPAPTTAAEARQQVVENRRQGRDAARAAMGRGTTSRAHGRGAGDASAVGATPTKPEPPTESTADPMAQPAESPATNSPLARPSGSMPATARPFDYARILRRRSAADVEEDDEEDADEEEANAEDAEAPATAEGVQAEAGVDDDDNTPESGVADGDHTTRVRT
ncbi:unnamed protein product, partial [Closterium sp. NIES-54]